MSKSSDLHILCVGELFGAEEIIENQDTTRIYTVTCNSSHGELYVIPKEIFKSRVFYNKLLY
jgi:hypothetical protein